MPEEPPFHPQDGHLTNYRVGTTLIVLNGSSVRHEDYRPTRRSVALASLIAVGTCDGCEQDRRPANDQHTCVTHDIRDDGLITHVAQP